MIGLMPTWVLSISYWLHMIATVIWLGGLSTIALFVLPFIHKTIDPDDRERLLSGLQSFLNPIGWSCLFILIGTGMFQMSAHPSYQGFLAIDNAWAVALFIKHIIIVLMVVAMGFMTWFVIPGLKRLALKQKLGKDISLSELIKYRKQEKIILWVNLILAFFVLIFTAWARAVS